MVFRLIYCYRIVSAGIVPLTLAPFAAGSLNPVTDSIFCALLVIHSHIGFEYVSVLFLDLVLKAKASETNSITGRVSSTTSPRSVYQRHVQLPCGRSFETNDVGITEAVARLWHA
jgi:succinate dehydrogenase (ubiquinone) membrane anchor subunit